SGGVLRPSPQTTSRPPPLGAQASPRPRKPRPSSTRPACAPPRVIRDPTGPALLPRRRRTARARRGLAVEGARARPTPAAPHALACTAEDDLGRGAHGDFGEETCRGCRRGSWGGCARRVRLRRQDLRGGGPDVIVVKASARQGVSASARQYQASSCGRGLGWD
ncbi:hypothetical protein DFH09DRAFT_1173595, partial [Mycena vulgaris]